MNIEVFALPGSFSGTEVLHDLAKRIECALARNCCFSATNSYRGYRATLQIEIDLDDVAPQHVGETIRLALVTPSENEVHTEPAKPVQPSKQPDPAPAVRVRGFRAPRNAVPRLPTEMPARR